MADERSEVEGKLRWGVLGPGGIARRFAGDLPASKTGQLVAVGSRDGERARAFADEFGAERSYGSYEELLADPEVDAVYIATLHPQHAEWSIKAAEAGKHILCEKPIAMNRAQAMAVIEAAREHDVFLMEAFMYKCVPQTLKLAELVRSGAIGEVRQVQAAFSFHAEIRPGSRAFEAELGGGGILDVGCYPISFARLIAGAATGELFADPVSLTGTGTLGSTGVDEWAIADLQFASGIHAQVATGVRVSGENDVRIFGSGGYILARNPWLPGRDGGSSGIQVFRVGEPVEEIAVEETPLYAAEADAVAAHLAAREAPQMSWADTLGNMAALDAWRSSLGLVYPSERPDAAIPTVHGRPLARRSDARMIYGSIPGVTKDVSRLVLGVDNQTTLPFASAMFDDFFERGGNTFDTAYIYGGGICEKMLGQWIRNRGVREDVVVIDKGAHTPFCDPESLARQFAESLDRLQTDYVDVYFMHRDNPEIPVDEFVDVLDSLASAGQIRAYGGSNWAPERIAAANEYAAKASKQPFVAVSNNFSLARALDVPWAGCVSSSDDASRSWLEETQLVLMPWSSQARGFFTGRARPEDRSDDELVRCWYSDDNFERLARAQSLASKLGVAPTAVALAYVLHQSFPTFPLIGPRQISETRSSLDALTITLSPEEVRWLDLRD